MAVDSRAAAPQNDATAGRTRARARPGNGAARKPPAAPGSPRAHWCADSAQQQLARRPGGALRSTRQEKATPCAPHRGITVGGSSARGHGNCAAVRRSEPRDPRADCSLGHGVATALRHGFVPRFARRKLEATALRLSEQVQRILDAVCAVYGNTVPGSGTSTFFMRYFFIAAIPRRPATSDAIHYATSRAHPPRNYPKTTGPRRHDAANDARARSETTATPPLRPGLPPQ